MIVTKEKISEIFNSVWVMPILFSVAFLFWALDLSDVAVCIFALFMVLNLLLIDDVKPILAPMLYVHFYINVIYFSAHWLVNGICIGMVVLSFFYYLIKQLVKRGRTLKKGRLFWAIVVSDVAFLLAGIIGRFNPLVCLITLGFSLVVYFFYFLGINFFQNLREYLLNLFIIGGLFTGLQMIFLFAISGDFLGTIAARSIIIIGAQNINVAALFFGMGLIAVFAKAKGSKKDFLLFLLACLFAVFVFLTYCRTMIALALLSLVIFTIKMFRDLENKRDFIRYLAIMFLIVGALVAVFFAEISELVNCFAGRVLFSGDMNRGVIWKWSWERFLEYPVFGFGFVSDGVIPSLDPLTRLVMTHNTPLQYLTSLGVVGTVALCFFYFKKYQLMFKNFAWSDFFVIGIIVLIELSGLTDQAATMDFFVVTIIMLLLSTIEKRKASEERERAPEAVESEVERERVVEK